MRIQLNLNETNKNVHNILLYSKLHFTFSILMLYIMKTYANKKQKCTTTDDINLIVSTPGTYFRNVCMLKQRKYVTFYALRLAKHGIVVC